MISTIYSKKPRNAVDKSIQLTEIILEEFFKDKPTHLLVVRICDIAENRGGIYSLIERNIMSEKELVISSLDNSIFVISKAAAAEFILKSVEDALKKDANKKIIKYDLAVDCQLKDIAQRIAGLQTIR